MSSTLDGNRLKSVKVSGKSLSKQLTEACISANLSASISQVTELKLSFQDSRTSTLFRGGRLSNGKTISYGSWSTTVAKISVSGGSGGPEMRVSALSRGVTKLRKATGSKNWGKRDVASWVKGQAKWAGFKHWIVQPGLGKRTIVRAKPDGDKRESSWDVLSDLAKELGVWLFEYGNTLVFAKPTWLVKRPNQTIISLSWSDWDTYSGALAGMPEYEDDADSDLEESLKFQLVSKDADSAKPGQTVRIGGSGVGPMRGTWIITSVSFPMTRGEAVNVTCQRPINPEKQVKKKKAKKKTTSKKSTGRKKTGGTKSKSSTRGSKANSGASSALNTFARKYNGSHLDWDGGYGAQCVDLAKAWNESAVRGPVVRGNGKDWVANCVRSGAYTRISAGSTARLGDIVCWDGSWGRGYGHVGVVVEDLGSHLRTFDQLNGTTGYHTLSKRGLIGYARPKKWS